MAAAGFVVVEVLLVDRPAVVLLLCDAIHHYQGVCSAVDRSCGDDGSCNASSAAACSFTTATASCTFFPPADCCIQSFFQFWLHMVMLHLVLLRLLWLPKSVKELQCGQGAYASLLWPFSLKELRFIDCGTASTHLYRL